ncbi:MAG: ABC transporter ATP-binding protein/permease, partial [Clostridiales bacterium]|nr:ABC transporter ATP-binding protein/permease [Clostridiales bacterium]
MKKRSKLSVMLRLAVLVKPLSGYMALAIIMGLCGNLCAVFITVFGGYAALNAARGTAYSSLVIIFVSVAVFALLRAFLRYAEQTCNHFIAFKLLAQIRDKIFRALRRLCPAKLDGRDKGDLISVITSDIELLEVFYAHTISPEAIALLFSAVMCVFIGNFHPLLAVVSIAAYLTVGVVIPIATSKLSGDVGLKFREKSGALSSFVLDSLRGLSEIIQFSAGKRRIEEMNRRTDELSEDEKKMKRTAGRNSVVTDAVILLFDIIMLTAAAALYSVRAIDASGVIIPVIALISSFGPTSALAGLGSSLQNFFAAANRVIDILDENPVVCDIEGKPEIAFEGAEAKNAMFSYGAEAVLSDASLSVPKGRIAGIVGKSGSGKSTLLKLFMRFWKTDSGSIKISNTEISDINTENLRNMESLVTQETYLFRDSIANNLKIAKPDAADEELVRACKKASVHDFI